MKKHYNKLGHSFYFQEQINNLLEELFMDNIQILKTNKELFFIKKLSFFFNDENNLVVKALLKSGEEFDIVLNKEIIDNDVFIEKTTVESFFSQEKFVYIEKFLINDKLEFDYLSAYEPELLIQLTQLHVLKNPPSFLTHCGVDSDLGLLLQLK